MANNFPAACLIFFLLPTLVSSTNLTAALLGWDTNWSSIQSCISTMGSEVHLSVADSPPTRTVWRGSWVRNDDELCAKVANTTVIIPTRNLSSFVFGWPEVLFSLINVIIAFVATWSTTKGVVFWTWTVVSTLGQYGLAFWEIYRYASDAPTAPWISGDSYMLLYLASIKIRRDLRAGREERFVFIPRILEIASCLLLFSRILLLGLAWRTRAWKHAFDVPSLDAFGEAWPITFPSRYYVAGLVFFGIEVCLSVSLFFLNDRCCRGSDPVDESAQGVWIIPFGYFCVMKTIELGFSASFARKGNYVLKLKGGDAVYSVILPTMRFGGILFRTGRALGAFRLLFGW